MGRLAGLVTTNGANGLADLLKEATAEAHRSAENHAFQRSLVRGRVSRAALVRHQTGLLELVRAIETGLAALGSSGEGFRKAMRAHAARLEADLGGLRNGEPGPPSPGVRAFRDALGGDSWPPQAALAAFYVIEGSMNGNRFIRRALLAARPDLAGHLAYFDPYGGDQRRCWQETRTEISRIGKQIGSPEVAVRAARATFEVAGALASEAVGSSA